MYLLTSNSTSAVFAYNPIKLQYRHIIYLQMIIGMLHTGCQAESSTAEEQQTLTCLLRLLDELASDASLATAISSAVNKEVGQTLLNYYSSVDYLKPSLFNQKFLLTKNASEGRLNIHATPTLH